MLLIKVLWVILLEWSPIKDKRRPQDRILVKAIGERSAVIFKTNICNIIRGFCL